ncbi:hypothetical protein INT46_008575 [Mucor plumbeus]|uniref:Uncharacterized protein n=1 Tax=Mucor plumbeus TaxID=97098 RepID=A0A8H7RHM7_9FUNG|nr:hypothetical protein INT46_008575 [Mucor plumbeus]
MSLRRPKQRPVCAKAAEVCGIPSSLAYQLSNKFNAGNKAGLPESLPKKRNSPPKKNFPEHSAFLIKLFDENPSIVLVQVKEELERNSERQNILTIERDAPRTIDLRYDNINKLKAAGIDYQRDCVFIDEARFSSQLIRPRAWSKFTTGTTVDFSKFEPLKKTDAVKIEKEFYSKSDSKKRKALSQKQPTKTVKSI